MVRWVFTNTTWVVAAKLWEFSLDGLLMHNSRDRIYNGEARYSEDHIMGVVNLYWKT